MRIDHQIIALGFLLASTVIFADVNSTPTDTTNGNDNTTTTVTSSTSSSADDDIVSAVYKKYAKESALIGTSLTVTAHNGIVTVSGTVTSQSQADQASIAAKSVPGVKDVRSTINVTTNPNLNEPIKKPPNY